MSYAMIEEILKCSDRHKLFVLSCEFSNLESCISTLENSEVKVINIGQKMASYIDSLDNYDFLSLDVADYLKSILSECTEKNEKNGIPIVAIHNLGILLEPALELNATQLLKEFSKTAALIIIWENQSDIPDRLHWSTQQNNIFLDFTETALKKLQYAI